MQQKNEINRNMRCIEIKIWRCNSSQQLSINRNMRCIEIGCPMHGRKFRFRLIET